MYNLEKNVQFGKKNDFFSSCRRKLYIIYKREVCFQKILEHFRNPNFIPNIEHFNGISKSMEFIKL